MRKSCNVASRWVFGVVIVADSTLSGPAQEEIRRHGVVRALRRKLYIEPVSHREFAIWDGKVPGDLTRGVFTPTSIIHLVYHHQPFLFFKTSIVLSAVGFRRASTPRFLLSPRSYRLHWLIDSLSHDNDYESVAIRYGCYPTSAGGSVTSSVT